MYARERSKFFNGDISQIHGIVICGMGLRATWRSFLFERSNSPAYREVLKIYVRSFRERRRMKKSGNMLYPRPGKEKVFSAIITDFRENPLYAIFVGVHVFFVVLAILLRIGLYVSQSMSPFDI